jgi:hypothetical protein
MKQPVKRLEMTQLRQEIRALFRLSPLVLAAVLAVAMLWQADSAAISGFFQDSPLSPVETPTTFPEVPTLTPTLEAPATIWPTVPSFPTTPAPIPSATVMPTLTLPTEMVPPTATITATTVATATASPPTSTPAALPTGEPSVEPTTEQSDRYPEESTGLKFDWNMLFDSTALFLSRLWLCCGVLVFLAIPVAFVVLWVASKRRQERGG